jgi:hypothetical protein
MNYSNIWRRAGLGLVALAISLSLQACGSTGQAHGEIVIPVPFSDDIRIEFFVSTTGEKTFDVNAGPNHAGKCFKITWLDEDGNEISTSEGTTDNNGFITGSVPDEATQFEGELARCPQPDTGKQAGSAKMLEPPVEQDVVRARSGQSTDLLDSAGLTSFLVFGGPLMPDDDPGKDNLAFGFRVLAADSARAEALLDPVLQGGIGSAVPRSVEVLRWTTMESIPGGSRLTTALPGQFEVWAFDFNDGVYTADLQSNTTRYAVGSWDVVETNIPISAFDQGVVPGAVYTNRGSLAHKTDRMPAIRTIRDAFEVSN